MFWGLEKKFLEKKIQMKENCLSEPVKILLSSQSIDQEPTFSFLRLKDRILPWSTTQISTSMISWFQKQQNSGFSWLLTVLNDYINQIGE